MIMRRKGRNKVFLLLTGFFCTLFDLRGRGLALSLSESGVSPLFCFQ